MLSQKKRTQTRRKHYSSSHKKGSRIIKKADAEWITSNMEVRASSFKCCAYTTLMKHWQIKTLFHFRYPNVSCHACPEQKHFSQGPKLCFHDISNDPQVNHCVTKPLTLTIQHTCSYEEKTEASFKKPLPGEHTYSEGQVQTKIKNMLLSTEAAQHFMLTHTHKSPLFHVGTGRTSPARQCGFLIVVGLRVNYYISH